MCRERPWDIQYQIRCLQGSGNPEDEDAGRFWEPWGMEGTKIHQYWYTYELTQRLWHYTQELHWTKPDGAQLLREVDAIPYHLPTSYLQLSTTWKWKISFLSEDTKHSRVNPCPAKMVNTKQIQWHLWSFFASCFKFYVLFGFLCVSLYLCVSLVFSFDLFLVSVCFFPILTCFLLSYIISLLFYRCHFSKARRYMEIGEEMGNILEELKAGNP